MTGAAMAEPFEPRFVDLVRNHTTTTGTGSFVLGPAVSGFSGFAAALSAGDRFYYCATNADKAGEREVGRGTLTADGKILREPVRGALVNFTSGSKTIALVAAAEWFASAGPRREPTLAELPGTAVSAAVTSLDAKIGGRVTRLIRDPDQTANTLTGQELIASGRLTQAQVSAILGRIRARDKAGSWWVADLGGEALRPETFGAAGDGLSDDGAAFQALLDYAHYWLGGGKRIAVTGRHRITGPGLTIRSVLTLSGPAGYLANSVAENDRGHFIFDSDVPGAALFNVSGSNFASSALKLENFKIVSVGTALGQKMVRWSSFQNIQTFENLWIGGFTGPVFFWDQCYSEGFHASDLTVSLCGGFCAGELSQANGGSPTGLCCTQFQLDNVQCIHGFSQIAGAAQAHWMDLRNIREVTVRNLVIQGLGAAGMASVVSVGEDTWYRFDGFHQEIVSDAPDYGLALFSGNSSAPARMHVTVSNTNLKKLLVDGGYAIVKVSNWSSWDAAQTSDLVTFTGNDGSVIEVEQLETADAFHVDQTKPFLVRSHRKGIQKSSTWFAPELLMRHEGGWKNDKTSAFLENIADYSHYYPVSVSGTFPVTDPVEGRVSRYVGMPGSGPDVRWRLTFPAEMIGEWITLAYRYKVSSTAGSATMQVSISAAVQSIERTNVYGEWATGLVQFKVDAAAYYLNVAAGATAGATATVDIGAFELWRGLSASASLASKIGPQQPIEIRGSAVPTQGSWIVGDRVINSGNPGGGPKGWTCTASGTPGSWTTWRDDAELLNRANHSGTQPASTIAGLAAVATSGSATDLATGTLAAARMPAYTGDVTSSAGSVALSVASNAVTYAKMQDVSAASRVLGRGSSGAGDPQELILGNGLTISGTTLDASATVKTGGWTELTLASDFVNSTATLADVTDGTTALSFTPPINSNFEVQAALLIQSPTATVSPRMAVVIPAFGTGAFGSVQIDQTGASTSTRVTADGSFATAAATIQAPAADLPSAGAPYLCFITVRGRSGATAGPVKLQMAAETAGTACLVRAGSQMRAKAS